MDLYPPVETSESGLLDVGDGNRISWQASGNPDGKPVLVVHGGPGSGSSASARRYFDPRAYRIVQLDQRGCGRSVPSAADPATDMRVNTTHHLVADMERLRTHLGIERWLLYGGSWGSTLILAYAQRHVENVSGVVLVGVTTSRRSEIDWLYRGVRRFLPAEWERFRSVAGDDDVVAGYARLLEHDERIVRERAAGAWVAWEDAVISFEPSGVAGAFSARVDDERLAFVRICTHYFANAAWLAEGELLEGAERLRGIPGVLIHGALDLSSPLETAWELAQSWPGSELVVVRDAGHTGSAALRDAALGATERFKAG